jgi:8-oxo-dGTP diphosphatase
LVQREFPACPLAGTGAVIVDSLGRVLLIKRGKEPRKGCWSIPGGLVELGETLIEAAQREALEETGLIVAVERLIEVVDRIYLEVTPANLNQAEGAVDLPATGPANPGRRDNDRSNSQVRYHYVIVDYLCRIVSGEAHPASDAADLRWVSREEWTKSNLYELEELTIDVIEKGWMMAGTAGIRG